MWHLTQHTHNIVPQWNRALGIRQNTERSLLQGAHKKGEWWKERACTMGKAWENKGMNWKLRWGPRPQASPVVVVGGRVGRPWLEVGGWRAASLLSSEQLPQKNQGRKGTSTFPSPVLMLCTLQKSWRQCFGLGQGRLKLKYLLRHGSLGQVITQTKLHYRIKLQGKKSHCNQMQSSLGKGWGWGL